MIKQYQVTLYCPSGQYKPISTIVKADTIRIMEIGTKNFHSEVRQAGLVKICQAKNWDRYHLKQYGYTMIKMREYDLKMEE